MRRRGQVVLAATVLILLFYVTLRLRRPQRLPPQLPRARNDLKTAAPPSPPDQRPLADSVQDEAEESGTSYIFAFGDSYTTYGFESDGKPPSSDNPLGNRLQTDKNTTSVQLVTSTPKWLDFLINDLSPPNTLAYNYGRGASTVDDDLVAPHFWGAKSLVTQTKEFFLTANDEKGPMHANWTAGNSAFVVWFGINDVANTADQKELGLEDLYNKVVKSYLTSLDKLYDAGARRFLILGLPPIDSTPSLILMGPPHTFDITTASQTFHTILQEHLKGWATAHNAPMVRFLDTQKTFHRVLDVNPADAKCTVEEKDSCLWVDMFHPAEKLQRAVGEEVARALKELGMWI